MRAAAEGVGLFFYFFLFLFFFRGALTLVWGLGVVITVGGLMNHKPEKTRVESVDGEARA